MRFRRRLTKTNTWPDIGLAGITLRTVAANPSKPRRRSTGSAAT
jgi:hypothetical protein